MRCLYSYIAVCFVIPSNCIEFHRSSSFRIFYHSKLLLYSFNFVSCSLFDRTQQYHSFLVAQFFFAHENSFIFIQFVLFCFTAVCRDSTRCIYNLISILFVVVECVVFACNFKIVKKRCRCRCVIQILIGCVLCA